MGSRWAEGERDRTGGEGDCVPTENRKLSSAPAPPHRGTLDPADLTFLSFDIVAMFWAARAS